MSNSIVASNFRIDNIGKLREDIQSLKNRNRALEDDSYSLNYILKSVKEAWDNPKGQDGQSLTENLEKLVNAIDNQLHPALDTFIEVMQNLVDETDRIQSKKVS